jgi:SAM-dependent methyltransferase
VTQLRDASDPPGTSSAAVRARAAQAPGAHAPAPGPGGHSEDLAPAELLTVQIRGYAHEHRGQRIAVLEAGCGLAAHGGVRPGLRGPDAEGLAVDLTGVDDEDPVTRAVTGARTDLDSFTLGDLRTVPLLPRSFDIVHCDQLLERIAHAELVLDRFVNGLRPGGLLLLRFTDRDSAAGFLDRKLPGAVRRLVWRRLQPGRPGPYPAVYERLVSGRGIQWYTLMRGLVIAERHALAVNAGSGDRWRRRFAALCGLVARLSRGRVTAEHDELLFVIRKPVNRFARVLLGPAGERRRSAAVTELPAATESSGRGD